MPSFSHPAIQVGLLPVPGRPLAFASNPRMSASRQKTEELDASRFFPLCPRYCSSSRSGTFWIGLLYLAIRHSAAHGTQSAIPVLVWWLLWVADSASSRASHRSTSTSRSLKPRSLGCSDNPADGVQWVKKPEKARMSTHHCNTPPALVGSSVGRFVCKTMWSLISPRAKTHQPVLKARGDPRLLKLIWLLAVRTGLISAPKTILDGCGQCLVPISSGLDVLLGKHRASFGLGR